jgi:pimeloyl-ACP methyl ester carboxylesterase
VQFVTVEPGVKLEVLDWGGTGRPLVFLAGLGFDAHGFDTIAPKLVPKYHVYAISRRGFGASSAPQPRNGNYSANRLGDDVLAVIDALKLQRPVLAGHSIAGEELSSIGTRHPEKVAALIYLDAGYPYACYDPIHGDIILDSLDLKKKLDLFVSAAVPEMNEFFSDLQTTLPRFENDVTETRKKLALSPPRPPHAGTPPPIYVAINAGEQKYTGIHAPVLAFFAVPHDLSQVFPNDPVARKAAADYDLRTTGAQADAFAKCAPGARIVRLPNANHWIFDSDEAEVLREMNAFLANLP